MAQMTLLDMTQNILSAMDSDNVNDIDATPESQQVATVIKETYFEIINRRDWPFLMGADQLTALGDSSNPTRMQIPSGVSKIYWIKYDRKEATADPELSTAITYKEPIDFIELCDNRDSTSSDVLVVTDSSGIKLNIRKDDGPQYCTSFDDEYIYFDSYASSLESTLQENKTKIHVLKEPSWSHTNTTIPDLPAHMFSMFLAEAKSVCMLNIKQMESVKEEQRSRRGLTRMQHASWRENGKPRTPNYGRNR